MESNADSISLAEAALAVCIFSDGDDCRWDEGGDDNDDDDDALVSAWLVAAAAAAAAVDWATAMGEGMASAKPSRWTEAPRWDCVFFFGELTLWGVGIVEIFVLMV